MGSLDFLDAHLNVHWLRPESALWDAIASSVISQFELLSPCLDLGSGNGVFSFITAGGSFSREFDWYRNVNVESFWDNADVYDVFTTSIDPTWIVQKARYQIDIAVDIKANLVRQAFGLGLYQNFVIADARLCLPFRDNSFQMVFSNILYWLPSPEASLKEVWRVLRPGGYALLCLQDHRFKEYCISYRWEELGSQALKLLNRGRRESSYWTISYPELATLVRRIGFKLISHLYYLSPLTLRVWDVGLRPLFPVLIKMVGSLDDAARRSIKSEWIGTVRPFLEELYEAERRSCDPGGYHCVYLQKA